MTHLDEGTLVALRDGDPCDAELEHLTRCVSCTDALDDARARSVAVADALASLDAPVDVRAARAAVRRRLDARRGDARAEGRWWRAHLGRAAAILLLSSGAAYALPGSPVRDWLGSSSEAQGVAPVPTASGATQDSPLAGISVAAPEGRIAVVVRGALPGSVIEVVWVDGPAARVSAPAGSGFTYADGRAEVDAAPGPIEVRLPRAANLASLEVDGRLFLRRSRAQVDVPGPAVARSEAGMRFVVPEG